MSAFKLEFTLGQHTPLIHFQHNQAGASLRATEVKARLDDFLLKNYKAGIEETWYIGHGTHGERNDSLAFKLSLNPKTEDGRKSVWTNYIETPKKREGGGFSQKWKNGTVSTETIPYPGFFGNMGKNYEESDTIKKFIFFPDGLDVTITSFHRDLIVFIKTHIAEFFATHNFGTRKTKGFGSFYPKDLKEFPLDLKSWFDYQIEIPFPEVRKNGRNETGLDYNKMFSGTPQRYGSPLIPGFFHKLDWFYRCLRGGINRKDAGQHDMFYFKSLLFLYFKNQNPPVQWEKKTIKEQFFLKDWTKSYRDKPPATFTGLATQKANRPGSDALHSSSTDEKLVKDLLGLSSEEMWLSYENDKITKTHQKQRLLTGEEKEIGRFASPIIFKPIEIKPGTMTVFIRFDETNLSEMLDQTFDIKNKNGDKINPSLKTPSVFSLDEYFKFIANPANFKISTHVESRFHNADEFKPLEEIFKSLIRLKP